MLLTGDSQATMWLSALNVAGLSLHFKVVLLAQPGCAPWGSPNRANYVIFSSVTVASCDLWRAGVVQAASVMHPNLVILVGRAYPVGHDEDVAANLADFEGRLGRAVQAFRSKHLKVAIFSPLPSFNTHRTPGIAPLTCLQFTKPITACELSPATLIDPIASRGERAIAASARVALVNITSLFCTSARCALFVRATDGAHLVYFDSSHMNHWYSNWIGLALAQLIKPLVGGTLAS